MFTPTADANGAGYASFTFQVQDDGGIANGGVDLDPTARTMSIDVTPVNDAPVLSGSNNMTGIAEDAFSNSGTLVSALIATHVSDVDAGSVSGLAVTAVDNSNGAWQYSTDGGTTWTAFGAPNGTTARLLAADASTYVRFVPNAGFNGTVAAGITFRAWDQTSGTAGGTADTSTNGGTTAFSPATASASITVSSANNAPSGADNTVTTAEDTSYAFGTVDFGFSDAADTPANALAAVKIASLPAAGTLTDNGVVVIAGQFVSVADITGGKLVFTPSADGNGAAYASFTFQVQDDGGTAGGGVDLDPTTRTMTINVTAVNDAPVLGNDTLTITRGGSVVLSGANLSATDIDSPAAGLVFTVSNVADGRFELLSAPGAAVTTFTQGAIAGGQVRFVHDGSNNAPAFDVMVSDGSLSAGPNGAAIVFSIPVVVGPGPVVAPPPPPPPVLTSNPEPPPPEPVQANPPAPVTEPETVYSPGRPVVPEAVGAEAAAAIPSLGPALRIEAAKLRAFTNPTPNLQATDLTLQIQGSEPTYMQFGPSTLASWSASTAFPDEGHGKERDQIQIIMETVEMGGIALSVGVVWWASRVGGLIGSLLASMPAWRHLDPLPIVGRDEEEEQWYEKQDADADADELAVSMVLEGGGGARTSAAA